MYSLLQDDETPAPPVAADDAQVAAAAERAAGPAPAPSRAAALTPAHAVDPAPAPAVASAPARAVDSAPAPAVTPARVIAPPPAPAPAVDSAQAPAVTPTRVIAPTPAQAPAPAPSPATTALSKGRIKQKATVRVDPRVDDASKKRSREQTERYSPPPQAPTRKRPHATDATEKVVRKRDTACAATGSEGASTETDASTPSAYAIPISEQSKRVLLGQVSLNKQFSKSYAARAPMKKPPVPNWTLGQAFYTVLPPSHPPITPFTYTFSLCG